MLNLNYFFAQYGKKFVRELTDNVRKMVGVDGVPYAPLKLSSAAGQTVTKVRRKRYREQGVVVRTEKQVERPLNSRLNHTLQFRENAFVSDSSDYGVQVSVNDQTYPGEGKQSVSYEDIVAYNDKHSPDVNPNIDDAPAIFPQGPTAQAMIEGMETYQEMDAEIRRVIEIQMQDSVKDIDLHMKIVI